MPADALRPDGTRLYADTVLTLIGVFEQCLLMAVKCSQKITFEDMWPKFINTVPADALGLNGTRLYADTVLTLIGVFEQCLLMAVKYSQKITFEDMWPKFINTVPADALGLNVTRLYADTVLTLVGVFEQCLLMAVKCSQKITFEDMWPKFINTVPAGALGLNGTRLYTDTVLTLTGVSEQCLLMAVKCSQKITFEDMWPKFSILCLQMPWD